MYDASGEFAALVISGAAGSADEAHAYLGELYGADVADAAYDKWEVRDERG